jgi:uncharacterized membrane protein
MIEITGEQATTIRFQLLYATGLLAIAMLGFFVVSQSWTMDIRYVVFAVGALISIAYLKDALIMFADIFIVIMKMRGNK